jgi:hypothetical protein
MNYTWTCRCCGKQFEELPLSFAPAAPDPWIELTEEERAIRGRIDSDLCVIDQQYFFVRGCLEIPIIDPQTTFVWGVWVSVAKQNFERILELWDSEIRESEAPIFGWLCNNISIYPTTFGLKTLVHLRNAEKRPFIELEPTDHPLAVEQQEGISLSRVTEIAAALLPGH